MITRLTQPDLPKVLQTLSSTRVLSCWKNEFTVISIIVKKGLGQKQGLCVQLKGVSGIEEIIHNKWVC